MAERWNFTRVGSLHVVLLGGLLSVTLSAPNLAQASTRALQDRTDPSGISPHQLHLLYVVPKNGVDRSLDTNGVIAASAELAVAWLKGQNVAHRTIRLDRFGPSRQPDITFVQLDRDEESVYQHPNPLGSIEWELSIRGLLNEEKIYAAYYEGRFDPCAAAVQPPNIGRLALLAIGDERCRVGLLKPPLSRAGEWELTLVHETFHLLGAVDPGARHATSDSDLFEAGAGHLFDGRFDDLMSWGSWDTDGTIFLDHGHDDYWEHGDTDMVDVSNSLFMEPAKQNAVLPPGWPLQTLQVLPVSQEPSLRSVGQGDEAVILIVNASKKRLLVYRKNKAGDREEFGYLAPLQAFETTGFKDDVWVLAEGPDRDAVAVWKAPAGNSRAIYVS